MVGAGPREGLLEFLDVLWGERGTPEVNPDQARNDPAGDYVCIATIDQDKNIRRYMFQWPLDSASIVTKIFKESADRQEVYILPATFKTPANCRKDNFKKSHTVWVDFDGNAPDLWDEGLHGIPKPTMRIISSTVDRQHNYWKLEQPCYDYVELESRNRTLAYTLEADVGGWDCVQLLRPPHTTNYGYAKPNRKQAHDVITEELIIDRKYALDTFGVNQDLVAHTSNLQDKASTVNQLLAMNKWTDQLLDDWDHIPDEGVRSDALVSMAHQAAEIGWSSEAIFSLIFHMDEKTGKYTKRSDRLKRLNDIVDRVIMKHRSRKDRIVVDSPLLSPYFDLADLDIHFNWIVEGFMPEKALGLLVSPPGLGKTTLAIRMGLAIAGNHESVFDHIIPPSGDNRPVLMYSLEMGAQHLSKFAKDMKATGVSYEDYKKFIVYPSGREMFLDTPEGKQFFEDTLKNINPKVVFIDSLNKIIRQSIVNDDAIRQLMTYLAQVIQDYNFSLIILHHDRKRQQGQSTTELDDVYGSRFLTSEADFVMTLARTKEHNVLELHYPKSRFGEQPTPKILRRTNNLDFEVDDEKVGVKQNATVRHDSSGESSSGDSKESPFKLLDDQ